MRNLAEKGLHITFTFAFAMLLAPSGHAQTGRPVSGLEGFDTVMNQTMTKWNLPGGALAIMNGSRLVFARGYGWADRDLKLPAQRDSLFRIGSNSKTITAAAVLKLVQDGKLGLDQTIVDVLGPDILPPSEIKDARWRQITVRHLLQHSGGWDADVTGEPVDITADVLHDLGIPIAVPLSADAMRRFLIRFMASQPLQFDPGTKYVYSNFGYCLLGRVVGRASGMPHAD